MVEQTKPGAVCSALDIAIAGIRTNFLNRLVGSFQTLEGWADQFDCKSEDPTPLVLLAAEVHKINGIAKSVGFETLGNFAKNAEYAINEYLTDGDSSATPESVLEMVDAMLCEIEVTISNWRATEL